MNIRWSPEAIQDLASLREFIARDEPLAAERIALRIIDNVENLLPDHPQIGRPGRVPGTRELAISGTPYVVPYRVQHGTLQVLRVYHGARRWPDRF
jgi:toxin ParE1/3/4